MLGVLVNTGAIVIGGLLGLLIKKGVPKRFSSAIMIGIGLCVLLVGVSGALQYENKIIVIVSIVLGVVTGTALKIDSRLNLLGEKLEKRFGAKSKSTKNDCGEAAHDSDETGEANTPIAQGFVTGSLLFCIGAMAIIGSIDSGLTGDHTIIYTKSMIDFIAAAMIAVTLGVGVIFSAASVFIYQGALVLLAQLLRPLLVNQLLITEMNSVGSIIIIALGLNLIGLTKIKVANFLPAIMFAPLITALVLWLF